MPRASMQVLHTPTPALRRPTWTARRVLDRAFDMAQAEIVRLRSAHEPSDLLLTPAVGDIGMLEFYRAHDAIAAGARG